MKLTLNIETNDPADLERIAAALAGKGVVVTPPVKPNAAAPKTAAAPSAAQQTEKPADTATAATSATTSPSEGVPAQADIVAAANAAVKIVGNGGPDKVKAYIAANFTKADGSPGTLNTTAENQKAALLKALQGIGNGSITV